MNHDISKCSRVMGTEHYSNKNWSVQFSCPVCGLKKRQSLNFLGCRVLVCNGVNFKAVDKKSVD